MNNVSIISKASHQIIDSGLKYDFDIQENSVVLVEVSTKQIKKIERIGNDLFIHFNDSDEVLKITNFYNNQENSDNSLVFLDDDQRLLWIQHLEDLQVMDNSIPYQVLDDVEPLLYHDDSGFMLLNPWWFAGGAGVLGAAAIAASGGSGSSDSKEEQSTETPVVPVEPSQPVDPITPEEPIQPVDPIAPVGNCSK